MHTSTKQRKTVGATQGPSARSDARVRWVLFWLLLALGFFAFSASAPGLRQRADLRDIFFLDRVLTADEFLALTEEADFRPLLVYGQVGAHRRMVVSIPNDSTLLGGHLSQQEAWLFLQNELPEAQSQVPETIRSYDVAIDVEWRQRNTQQFVVGMRVKKSDLRSIVATIELRYAGAQTTILPIVTGQGETKNHWLSLEQIAAYKYVRFLR